MALLDVFDEVPQHMEDIRKRLARAKFRKEGDEIDRMAFMQGHADLRLAFEPTNTRAVAGAWVDDNDWWLRLSHASQSKGAWDRTLRRANKIRQRLGGDSGMASLFPPRPKGMWQKTFERLREQVFDAEMLAEEAFEIQASKLLARINKPKRKRTVRR